MTSEFHQIHMKNCAKTVGLLGATRGCGSPVSIELFFKISMSFAYLCIYIWHVEFVIQSLGLKF